MMVMQFFVYKYIFYFGEIQKKNGAGIKNTRTSSNNIVCCTDFDF